MPEAAFEIAVEFALSQRRSMAALPVFVRRQPGGEVRLYQAIENGLSGWRRW